MAVSQHKNGDLATKSDAVPPEEIIFGCSRAMAGLRHRVAKVAATDVAILLQGESGTGKGLLARHIHSRSRFAKGAFVKVNCAAIPENLLESELFGYEKGAFTDAYTSQPGHVEMAQGGTLFLDEIGDLALRLQAKILHLLQDGHFSRIGDKPERRADVRIICATSRNLGEEVAAGRFRQDLFYRINVITLCMPPLRERIEDIPVLAEHFLTQSNIRYERNTPPLDKESVAGLGAREWRGNIRELENLIARYSILGSMEAAKPEPLRMPRGSLARVQADGTIPLKRLAKQAIREMEGNLILKALKEHKWNRRKAAEALNISYRALLYKIREVGAVRGSRQPE